MSFSAPDVMSNPRADRVRDVARLATRAGRAKRGLFLAEGPQAVREALALHRQRLASSGAPVVESVYATADFLEHRPELAELVAVAAGTRLRLATEEVLAAMADTVSPQGIIAVCHLPGTTLDAVLAGKPRLVAVMCRVQDPGNAGTILRAADAAGADAVILTEGSVDIHNPKAVRSTVGSIFHLPIVSGVAFADLVEALRGAGLAVLAADGYGDTDLDALQDASAARRLARALPEPGAGQDPDTAPEAGAGVVFLEAPTAWLFGNEAQGLDKHELAAADRRVAVPLYGVAESLNVGTAATVCLYASARAQRRA